MKYLSLLLILITLCFSAQGKDIYVSTIGKDDATGLLKSPFKTIHHAVQVSKPGDRIIIREGDYSEQVQIYNKGSFSKKITIRNFPGEKVRIIPSFIQKKWTISSKNIYYIKTTEKITQLFDNQTPLFQASFPNIKEGELNTFRWAPIFANPNKQVFIKGINKYKNLMNAYFVGIAGRGLTAVSGRVKNHKNNKIIIENDGFYWKKEHANAYLGKGKGYLVGNQEFLDAPGEWFQKGEKLYFWPNNEEQLNRIRLRSQSNSFQLINCKNITIIGLEFFGTEFIISKSSKIQIIHCVFQYPTPFFEFEQSFDRFAGIIDRIDYSKTKNWAGKGVQINGENIQMDRCVISHSWGDGITLSGENNQVISCRIEDANWMGTDAAPLTITGNKHLVKNCFISKSGRSVLVHRKLTHSRICFNEISEAGKLCDDLGLLYTYDTDGKGTEIDHNWIHNNDAPFFGSGIYLDNYHSNFSVHHNVVYNCFVGITINQIASNDSIFNNTLIHNRYSMGSCSPDGLAVKISNIYTFNNITDSDLKARDHRPFYGTFTKNNFFIPNLSQQLLNPSNRQFSWQKTNGINIEKLKSGAYPINSSRWKVSLDTPSQTSKDKNWLQKIESNTIIHPILYLFYLSIIIFSIFKSQNHLVPKSSQYLLLSIKIVGGFLLYWIYTTYYTNRESADLFKHYDDSYKIYQLLNEESPSTFFKFALGLNDNSPIILNALKQTNYWNANNASLLFNVDRQLIHLHLIILFFSFGYFPIHLLFFTYISYRGSLKLIRYFRTIYQDLEINKILIVSFLPTLLIFTSGSLKDTIIYYSFTSLFIHLTAINSKSFFRQILPVLIYTYILGIFKTYLLIAFIPSIPLLFLSRKIVFKYKYILFVFSHILFFTILLSNKKVKENLLSKKNDLILVSNELYPSSRIPPLTIDNHTQSFIDNIPKSLQNVYVFPSELSFKNVTYLVFFIENMLLFTLIVLSVIFPRKLSTKNLQIKMTILSISIVAGIIIGWTVPIWGAIIRYKAPFLGLLISVFILSINWKQLKRFFNH